MFALCCLVRHFFVNEAYDNLDSMAMGNTNRGSSEYAEPVTPNGTHPSSQTAPRQDPAIYFTGKHSKKEKKLNDRVLRAEARENCSVPDGVQTVASSNRVG